MTLGKEGALRDADAAFLAVCYQLLRRSYRPDASPGEELPGVGCCRCTRWPVAPDEKYCSIAPGRVRPSQGSRTMRGARGSTKACARPVARVRERAHATAASTGHTCTARCCRGTRGSQTACSADRLAHAAGPLSRRSSHRCRTSWSARHTRSRGTRARTRRAPLTAVARRRNKVQVRAGRRVLGREQPELGERQGEQRTHGISCEWIQKPT